MGFAERPAVFKNTQLKTSYLLSSNAGPDSTHSTWTCKTQMREITLRLLSILGWFILTVTWSWALSMCKKGTHVWGWWGY